MLTPSETYNILTKLSHQPKKSLGQNFLIDGNIVKKSLSLANLQKNSIVVEIGPGLGTLTEALLKANCSVYAIEKDPTLAKHIKSTLINKYPKTLNLLEGDAVQFPLANLTNNPPQENFQIIANLPYAIASPWMEGVLEQKKLPTQMTLMLQKETADRYNSLPGSKNFGSISIFLHSAFNFKKTFLVSKSCFYPIPKVDSVLLHMELKSNPFFFNPTARKLIRNIFTQRRKQLGTLCKYYEKDYPNLTSWVDFLSKQEFNLKLRPEAVPIDIWKTLNNYVT